MIKYKRKIRIGFPLGLSDGGPSLFMKRLKASLDKQKLAKVSSFMHPFADMNIFANIARDLYRKPYIFRVDGIYFDKKESPGITEEKNRPIFSGIDGAIGIVFQSYFDYEFVTRFYGKINKPYEIINNGVDTNIFSSVGSNKRKDLNISDKDLVFITSAIWRAHKRLQDAIDVFIEYEKNSDTACHFIILGKDANFRNVDHPHIYNIGFVHPEELPAWYRTGNIFLFFSWLDHCPNTVVEAISCGLPVVCTNQGGTREIIEITHGGIVAEADEEFAFEPVELYKPPRPNHNVLLMAMREVADNYESCIAKIDRSRIDIDSVAVRYVKFAEKVLRRVN